MVVRAEYASVGRQLRDLKVVWGEWLRASSSVGDGNDFIEDRLVGNRQLHLVQQLRETAPAGLVPTLDFLAHRLQSVVRQIEP